MNRKFIFIVLFIFVCGLQLTTYDCLADDVKQPNVAGTFYPSDPVILKQTINRFLNDANPAEIESKVSCLISPHAGYEYSGAVAAFGYKAIGGEKYDTVVVIGISHQLPFNGVSIWPKGKFITPLGEVSVDEDTAKELLSLDPGIKYLPEAFSKEHSLEVQLPFLQTVLKDFKIVPLIIGEYDLDTCDILAHALSLSLRGKNALIVASSDMSHFFTYSQAKDIDADTLSLIKQRDIRGLYQKRDYDTKAPCGTAAILTVLFYAKENNINGLKVLKYANSGDVTGDLDRVVGYSSIVFYRAQDKDEDKVKGGVDMLNKQQRKKLLNTARQSIEFYLKNNKRLEIKDTDPQLTREQGAFVTLTEQGNLRGCIGHIIGDEPLINTISNMAVEAAVGDPRFNPVTSNELKDIEIEISVLSPLEKIDDINKIEVGKHGIVMVKGGHSAVFLPQVAVEQGWDRTRLLQELCHKAGLPTQAYLDSDAQFHVFTAEVFNENKY